MNKLSALYKQIFRKKYIIGLDIGSSSIKLAQFLKHEKGLHLINAKFLEILKNKDAALSLREILEGVDVKNSRVITLVNSNYAMVKRIVLPSMPVSELKEAISLEAKNYFPVSIADSLLDFEITGEVWEKGIKKTEVLAGVCPNIVIKEHLGMLSSAGIAPVRIIHPSLSLYNLLKLKKLKEFQNVAAVDIGKNFCELIIIKDDRLTFNRKLPVCADDFTKAAMSPLASASGKVQLTYEEAEKIKREYGLTNELSSQLIENKITTTQLFSLLRPVAEKLAQEIERSFDFYREETQGMKVESLLLFGGGANLKGLDKFLSAELEIRLEIYDASGGVKLEDEAMQRAQTISRAACAVGAGIAELKGINLLPEEMKQQTKNLAKRALLKAVLSAVLTLAVLTFIGLRIQLVSLDKKVKSAQFELEALKRQFGEPSNWPVINQVLMSKLHCEDVFKEVSFSIPSGICLNEMRMDKGLIIFKGSIQYADKPEKLLSDFIRFLENGIFKNVRFTKIEERQSLKEFELQMEAE